MVAAEILEKFDNFNPREDRVRVQADDAETYTSILSVVQNARFETNETDIAASDGFSVNWSGRVVTFDLKGTTTGIDGVLVCTGLP